MMVFTGNRRWRLDGHSILYLEDLPNSIKLINNRYSGTLCVDISRGFLMEPREANIFHVIDTWLKHVSYIYIFNLQDNMARKIDQIKLWMNYTGDKYINIYICIIDYILHCDKSTCFARVFGTKRHVIWHQIYTCISRTVLLTFLNFFFLYLRTYRFKCPDYRIF